MNALRFLPSRCVIVTNNLYWNPLILSFLGSVGRAEQINAAVPVSIIPKLLAFRSPPSKSCDFRWGLRSTFVQWRNSIYKQLTLNRKSLLRHLPASLQKAIVTAWNQHYEELYESESDGTVLLEDALSRILNSFQSSNQTFMQIRHVWMALTLAVVVEPTIKYYQPDHPIPEKTINKLTNWLLKTIAGLFYPQENFNREFDNVLNDRSGDINHLSSDKKISSFQVLSEALDVYISAVNTLEPSHSLQALLDILDDCLEGYAIFPGSYGRRELFNWWLLDVIPSCWYLLPPTSVYSLNELADHDSHQTLSQLEETSSLMWSLIEPAIQNQNIGSSLDDLLEEDGILDEVEAIALKRVHYMYTFLVYLSSQKPFRTLRELHLSSWLSSLFSDFSVLSNVAIL